MDILKVKQNGEWVDIPAIVGPQGEPGAPGQDGAPGAPGSPGTPGADGISPTITVTDITGGHRVTITDADGTHSFDVMDGEGDVTDVVLQQGGTSYSRLIDGKAVINVGDGLRIGNNSGRAIMIADANLGEIRTRSAARVITPSTQSSSIFYGLAWLAGDTTQAGISGNVGTYTESAKDKIQQMLGIVDMIAPHEGAQAANAYSAGGAFCYSGKLYKATASIAIGDAIVPGTNCTQTTLIELIGGI